MCISHNVQFPMKSSITTHCPRTQSTMRPRSINIISLCIVKGGFICSEKPSFPFYVPAMKSCRLQERGNQGWGFSARPQEDHEQCLTAPAVVRRLVKQVGRGERPEEIAEMQTGQQTAKWLAPEGRTNRHLFMYVCLDMRGEAELFALGNIRPYPLRAHHNATLPRCVTSHLCFYPPRPFPQPQSSQQYAKFHPQPLFEMSRLTEKHSCQNIFGQSRALPGGNCIRLNIQTMWRRLQTGCIEVNEETLVFDGGLTAKSIPLMCVLVGIMKMRVPLRRYVDLRQVCWPEFERSQGERCQHTDGFWFLSPHCGSAHIWIHHIWKAP